MYISIYNLIASEFVCLRYLLSKYKFFRTITIYYYVFLQGPVCEIKKMLKTVLHPIFLRL